jgi:hypothetical protein
VRHHRATAFLILSILLIIGNFACKRRKEFHGYDGTWWTVTPPDQKSGFIEGFIDCYTYSLHEGDKLQRPSSWYQKAISAYYREYGERSMTVGRVLIQVAETASPGGSESSDQARPGSGINREVWLAYSEKKRIGFVEGFLNALMPQDSRAASFPKNPEYYAKAITRQCSDPIGGQPQTGAQGAFVRQKTIGELLWDMRNRGSRKF